MTDTERWKAAAHAVQSGIAIEIERGSESATPKHLRVGVDMAMADHAGLVRLLIEKGVFTDEEYVKAIADEAERERARYEARLSQALGRPITLA